MTTDSTPLTVGRLSRGLRYSGALAVVWLIAAAPRPDVTYHLAPMLVAGALPVVTVFDGTTVPGNKLLVFAAGVGFLVAVATTGVLTATGWLQGPPLGPFDNAVGESVAGAGFGAVAGFTVAVLWRRQ
jgi:hypothetical protein